MEVPVRTSGKFKNIKELLITELCIITSDKLCKFKNCQLINKWQAIQWRHGLAQPGPAHWRSQIFRSGPPTAARPVQGSNYY